MKDIRRREMKHRPHVRLRVLGTNGKQPMPPQSISSHSVAKLKSSYPVVMSKGIHLTTIHMLETAMRPSRVPRQ